MQMFKFSAAAKRMLLIMTVICVVICGVMAIFVQNRLGVLLGGLLGLATSALKVWLLERAVNKAMTYESKQAALYMRAQYLARYFLTGGALAVAAINFESVNFWAAAVGILSMPASAYITRFLFRKEIEAEK
jgi:hypothetical protein